MNRFLKQTRLILFALLLLFASASYGQCGNVTGSVGFPNPGCELSFAAGDYIEVTTASNPFVDSWEYSYDGGGTFTTIPASGDPRLPYNLLNGVSGNPTGVIFRIKYVPFVCFSGYSNLSGVYSIIPKPVAGTFASTPSSLCSGTTQSYALTGANFLLVLPPSLLTTTYSITPSVTGSVVAGTATFTRSTNTSGSLSITPTNPGPTLGTATYQVYATNGSCAPVLIGTVGPICVYPIISGGSLSSTSVSLCSGGSATLSLPGFTNLVDAGSGCSGTGYALTSNAGSLSGSCGSVGAAIGGSFTTGSTPGTVTVAPTNTTNAIQTIIYTATITNGPCTNIVKTVSITVAPNITTAGISIASPTPTICTGQTATVNITNLVCATGYNSAFTAITVSAPVFGGAGSANMAGGSASAVTLAATSASFTVSPTITQCDLGTATYTISAQNSPCSPVVLGTVVITVYPAVTAAATSVTGTGTICTGSTVTSLTTGTCANGYSTSGGITSYTISVSSSGANIASTGLPGTLTNTTGSFIVAPTNTGCLNSGNTVTYQIRAVNNAACTPFLAGSFTVTVIPALTNTGVTVTSNAAPVTNTVCSDIAGGTIITVNNLICATGYGSGFTSVTVGAPVITVGSGTLTGGTPSAVTNAATSASFTIGAFTLTGGCNTGTAVYTITGQNAPCAPITLGTITITVVPKVVGGSISGSASVCSGTPVTNGIAGNNCANGHLAGTTSYTISVSSQGANIASNGLPGTTTNTTGVFTVTPTNTGCSNAANTVVYQITATNGSPCSAFSLGTFTLTVVPVLNNTGVTVTSNAAPVTNTVCSDIPGGTIITVNNLICATGYGSGFTSVTVGSPVLTNLSGGAASAVTNAATSASFTIGAYTLTSACNTGTAVYTITGQNAPCSAITLGTITITVVPKVTGGSISGTTSVCSGVPVTNGIAANNCVNGHLAGTTSYTLSVVSNGSNITSTGLPGTLTNTTGVFTVTPTNFNCSNSLNTVVYQITASNGSPCTSTSLGTFTLTVYPAPSSAGVISLSVTSALSVCSGDLSTLTSNRCAGVTATWEVSTNGGAFVAYAGMTDNGNATYTSSGLTTSACSTTTYVFRGTFTQTGPMGACAVTTTSSNTVSVFPAPTATVATITSSSGNITSSSNTDICTSTNTTTITSPAPACGSIVRWDYSINSGTSWTAIASSASNTLVVTNASQNTSYRAVISNGALCATTFSNVVTATVNVVNGGTTSTTTPAICNGSSATIVLSGSLGNVINWESAPTSGFASITSIAATTTSITVSPTSSIWYRAVLSQGICTTYSAAVEVKVYVQPTIPSFNSASAAICSTSPTVLTFSTGSTVAGVTTYRITSNYPSSNTVVYASSTTSPTSPLTVSSAYVNPNGATLYTFTVTSAPCAAIDSTFTVTVTPASVGGTVSTSATLCSPATGTLTLSGNTGSVTGWESSINAGATWSPIANTTSTLNYSAITATTMYRAVVQNGICASANSSAVTITVIAVPTASVAFNSSRTICSTTSTVLNLTSTGGTAGLTTYKVTSNYPSAGSEVYATNTTAPSSPITVDATNINPNGTTIYTYTVTSAPCAAVSDTEAITVNPASVGGTVSSSATQCSPASGTVTLTGNTGLVLNWESSINAGATWSTVANTTTSLTYSAITATTMYRAVVQNGVCASANSSAVTITVIAVPTASVAFNSSRTICSTTSTVLNLTSTGGTAGLTTYKVTSNYPSAGSEVYASNTTAPSSPLTVDATNVNPNGTTLYTYTVTSAPCSAVIDTEAITVNPASVGGTVSSSATQCSPASGTVTLAGNTGLVLNWELSTDGGSTWSTVANTTTSLTYSAITATTSYRAVVQNGVCASANSSAVTITVIAVPTASVVFNSSRTICSTSSTVLNLSSTGGTAGLTTYKVTSNYPTAGSEVYASNTAAPSSPLTVDATNVNPNGTTIYTYTVTSAPCAVVSDTEAITVNPASVGGTVSSSATQCSPATGTVTLAGNTGAVIRWELSTDGGATWSTVANTSTSLTYSAITATTSYRAVVQNGVCASANSSAVTITVIAVPTASVVFNSSRTICSTSSTVLNLASTGGTAGLTTYKVTSNYPTAGSEVYASNTAAPSSPLTVDATNVNPNGTTLYTYTVTSAPCAVVSDTEAITVNPASVGGTVSSSATQCSPATGTLTLAGNTGLVINWESSINAGATWSTIANTTTSLTYSAITATTMYRAVVQNGVCASANSSSVTITVIAVPTASVVFNSARTICSTTSTVLNLASTGGTAGLTTYKVTSNYPTAGSEVYATNTTAPSSPLTVDATNVNPTGTTIYTYTVTSAPCSAVIDTEAIIVNPASVGGTVSTSATQCSPATGTLTLAGNTGAVIRWELSTDGGTTWSTVANTTSSLTYSAITATTMYRAVVQNGVCVSANSSAVTITVIAVPTASVVFNSARTICSTTSTVLNLSSTGGTAGLTTYKVTSNYPTAGSEVYATNTTAPSSPLTVDATNVNPTGTTIYTYTVTSAPCSAVSDTETIIVNPASVGGTVSTSATQCSPASGTLTLAGNTGLVIRWELSTDGGTTWSTVANTTTSLTYSAITTTTMYRAVVQNGVCVSANSSAVTITVIAVPTASVVFNSARTICSTTSTVLNLSSTGGTAGLTTYKVTSNYPTTGSEVYASNTTAPSSPLTVDATNVNPTGTTIYTYTVTSAPCSAVIDTEAIIVNPASVGGTVSSSATLCSPATGTLTLAGNTGLVINWESSINGGTTWSTVANTTTSLTYTAITVTTMYRAVVQNGVCVSANSSAVTITVIQKPTIPSFNSTPIICASTSTVLSFSTANTTAGLTTYKITSDYPSAGSVVYATNTTAPASPLTVPSTYVNPNGVTTYTYSVSSAPCATLDSTFSVTVRPVPTALITLSPSTICLGSNTTLTINVGNVVGNVTTYAVGTSAGGTNIIGTTTISSSGTFTTFFAVTPPVGVTTYYLTVITSPCASISSNTSVTVNPTTVGGALSAGAIICPSSANSTTLSLSGQTGSVVKWQQSTNDGTTWTDITNTLTTYTATNISVSSIYRAVVQSGVCSPENSATSGIFVNTSPVANFTNSTVCFNTPPTTFNSSTTTVGTTLSAAQQGLYNITGTVTTTTSFAWTFGDPTSGSNTSTATNPTHAYTAAGTFSATLVATTSTFVNGGAAVASCSNSTTKSVTVNQVTTADYTTSPVCLGGASAVNINNFNTANTYAIVWGDATASQTTTTSTTTRTYGNAGQYSVRLRVTNAYGCSDSITKNVTAYALPVTTGVNISNTAPCVATTVTFTPIGDAGGTTYVINPATGVATATVANAASVTAYLWEFGDGNTANTRIATNSYAVAGTYTVKLTLTNSNGCSQMFTFTTTPVTVQPIPVASFTSTTECYGINTTFNSTSSTVASGSITGWAWNFGNTASAGNNTSTLQNPTHLFTAPGNYTVTLTVTTAAGCTNTVINQVTVHPLPLVNFNSSSNSACAGSTITFNSTSTISSGSFTYGWRVSDNAGVFNFAGAMVSANASLIQTFATAGTYNIRLYAQSANGCIDSATRTVTIFANPTAAIVVNPASNQICIYEAFTFTSAGSLAGSGTISTYAWTFGDGSTSTAANPAAKSYASPGTYTVTLTITNSNGCNNTISKTVIVNPKPVVNFTASNVCYGYTMTFTDASTTGVGTTYLWNFGDLASGVLNTATTQNSSHNFTTAGTYNVKLVVTNGSGCKDSLTKSVTVWPRPVADFKADTVCEGSATKFVNLSTIASGSMSYLWSFGDAANTTTTASNPTFLYTPGVYSVKLVVTSGFGCIDSIRKSILVKANPKPTFVVANACLRDAITLDTTGSNGSSGATLLVNYGDGSALTAVLTHTYAMSGVYTVTITLTDNGCSSTISKVVTIYDLPLPNFSVSAYTICVNAIDTFSNTSTIASGNIVSNKWEVINSSNTVVATVSYSSAIEFIYAFNTAGVYRVKLTSTSDKGCFDTLSKVVTVNALPTVAINSINFKAQAFHACLGTAHEFTSTGSTAGSGTIAAYYWDFGDGGFSSVANPVYIYKSVGTFMVTLTITNSNGCTFSKQQSVVVDAIPDATIKPSNFPVQTCNGTPFTFTGPSGTGYSYVWTRNGVVVGTAQTLTQTPATSGWYYLAVTSSFLCTQVDSIYLTVNPLPAIVLSDKTVTISKGWDKQVTAFVTGPNPTFNYVWSTKDANPKAIISNISIPNPILTPPNDVSTYYFVVTVTDQKGCVQRDTVFFTMLDDYNLKPTNLITPNGDGKNDVFTIENIETYPDVEVTIFNRWGNVVYVTKNYAAAPWNGTYNNTGGELPDGTYYYIIRTAHQDNGKELIYKGHITILRGR